MRGADRDTRPDFLWAVGEESSDPVVPHEGRRVRVDQMQSTGHLARMEADLADVAALGIRFVRYGINWRRTEPEPGQFSWGLWDRAFSAFEALGLEMIVDLLHFGTPEWLDGVGDPRLPDALLAYTEAFLARYEQPRWFTPVNEPFITAFFSSVLGIWNEARKDERYFVQAVHQLCLADLLASAAIRADRPAVFLQSEAFGHDVAGPDEGSRGRAARANAFRLLSSDLRYGLEVPEVIADDVSRVDDGLRSRVRELSFTDGVVAGHDFYPRNVPPDGPSYRDLASAFYARYRVPIMLGETSNLGLDPSEAPAWLQARFDDGCELRRGGVPFAGICWFSRGDQHDWDTLLARPVQAVTAVGLFDMERRPRPACDALVRLMGQPVPPVAGAA